MTLYQKKDNVARFGVVQHFSYGVISVDRLDNYVNSLCK